MIDNLKPSTKIPFTDNTSTTLGLLYQDWEGYKKEGGKLDIYVDHLKNFISDQYIRWFKAYVEALNKA